MRTNNHGAACALNRAVNLTEEDIYAAMEKIPGYLDITPGDFKELYRLAYQLAGERLQQKLTVQDIMTQEVIAVTPATPLTEVAFAMGQRGVSGVPVVD